ncbi:MAG: hypothetical protein IPL55_04105 [Saprospiraceae bacterium]|jgi:hypothetical protein|nr:hypothetical protein [Saprospiraceae bacterium]
MAYFAVVTGGYGEKYNVEEINICHMKSNDEILNILLTDINTMIRLKLIFES